MTEWNLSWVCKHCGAAWTMRYEYAMDNFCSKCGKYGGLSKKPTQVVRTENPQCPICNPKRGFFGTTDIKWSDKCTCDYKVIVGTATPSKRR